MILKRIFLPGALLAFHLLTNGILRAADEAPFYLFSYFKGNGRSGLHLAASRDGLEWNKLAGGKSFLTSTLADGLIRDPSIVQGADGTFHMVWTPGWWEKGIGYASSRDLITWSEPRWLPVMEHEPTALNSWAPELHFNPEDGLFMILWASTIPGRFPDTDHSRGDKTRDGATANHRHYFTTTRDFQKFSDTRLFHDPGFNSIDGTVVRAGERWLLVFKDETKAPEPKKNIRLAWGDSMTGPFGPASAPISSSWVEGPSMLRTPDGAWNLYFDAYTRKRYEGLQSADLKTWKPITDRLKFPKGIRHGTMFTVTKEVHTKLAAVNLPLENKAQAAAIPQKRPNILFIAVDDLKPELGCYGASHIKSPNIDRIAKAGMVFHRAYCQQAVCGPSRASVMTGARPDTTKVWDLKTHFRKALPDVVTLGQHFKQHGYFVQGMGKIYHGSLDDAATWSVPWQSPDAPTYALSEANPKKGKTGLNSRGPAFEAADVPDETFADGKLADLAVSALRDLSEKEEPFFLAVGFVKPHLPFVAPKKYWDLYDPSEIKLATNKFRPVDAPDYAVVPGAELRNYRGIPQGAVPDELARQLKHGYYASISYSDAQIGKLLDELDRLGLAKDTAVILWGDHGFKLGEHAAWCKHTNTEDDARAPLLLSVPGMRNSGTRTDALVEFVDIYPTLSELAGLPLPAHLEGTSLLPLLDDPQRSWKSAAFSQYPRSSGGKNMMGYSMRTKDHRFTLWVDRKDHSKVAAPELYDHRTDPQENQNLAAKPENAELVEELSAQLRAGWKDAKPK